MSSQTQLRFPKNIFYFGYFSSVDKFWHFKFLEQTWLLTGNKYPLVFVQVISVKIHTSLDHIYFTAKSSFYIKHKLHDICHLWISNFSRGRILKKRKKNEEKVCSPERRGEEMKWISQNVYLNTILIITVDNVETTGFFLLFIDCH